MLVEDDPDLRLLLEHVLLSAEYEVDTAATVAPATARLDDSFYDLVLADMRMPDGSGEDLYRAVASERADLAERFVFMTGDTANAAAWSFLEEASVPVVEKPFTVEQLMRRVREILDG